MTPKVKVTAPLQRTQLLPALEAAFRVVPAANLATGCPPSQRASWLNPGHVTPRSRSRRPCKKYNFCPLWKPHFGSYPRQTWPRSCPPSRTCVVAKSGSLDPQGQGHGAPAKNTISARSGSRISGRTRGKLGHGLSPVPTCVVAKSGSLDPRVKVTAPLQRTQLLPALEAAFRVVPAANLATGCPPSRTCVVAKSGSLDPQGQGHGAPAKNTTSARSGSRISGRTRGKLGHMLSNVPTCVVAKSGSRDPKVKVTAPLQRTQLLPALEAAFRVAHAANLATSCLSSQRLSWQNLGHVTLRSRSRRPCKEHNFCPLWKPHFGSYPRQTWPRVVPRPNVRRGKIRVT